jgi:hypothetical protein
MRGLLAKLANNKDLCQMSGIEMIFLSNNHTEYCPSMVDVLGGRPGTGNRTSASTAGRAMINRQIKRYTYFRSTFCPTGQAWVQIPQL